tara:strand:+ start:185 stop:496 length:312 start_codon:yes stop_codon:yes gene_type:complete
MPSKTKLPTLFKAIEMSSTQPELLELLKVSSPEDQEVILLAIRTAYQAGQDDADKRTGKLMARIFGGFVGVTPGVDLDQENKNQSGMMRGMVRMLAGVASGDK